ncbi:MAG: hypothetical protein WBF38_02500 [Nitrosotalea sp.]
MQIHHHERFLVISLALVLAGAAMPVAFSYQGEDQKRPAFLGHDRFSFNGFSNQTQFSFGGFANKTNQGQEISYLMHGINYLKKEIANAVKEQKKDGKLQESPKTLGHPKFG